MASQGIFNFPEVVRGDDTKYPWDFEITEETVAIDLTGALIRLHFRSRNGGLIAKKFSTETGEIVITDAALGKFQILAFNADFKNHGIYDYDVEITLANGDIFTYIKGYITVLEDITK